jgi:hypothetical protein
MAKGDRDSQDRKSGAAGHADRGGQPDGRRRRQTPNDILANKDEAAADEADPGHDLRRDTRRIEHHPARLEDVGEAVFGDQHHERGREADERVGAQAGALLANFALEADRGGQDERERKFSELERALAHGLAYERSKVHHALRSAIRQRTGALSSK